MLPDEVLSSEVVYRPFSFPRNVPKADLIDYSWGGVDLNDGSQGLRVKVWKCEYFGEDVILSADGVADTTIITVPNIVSVAFAFDANMNPFIAYELENGDAKFYWFDSTLPGFTTTTLAAGSRNLRCAHDDTRDTQVIRGVTDVILAYVRDGSLYFRAQRERYLDEHLLSDEIGDSDLMRVGLNDGLRFQFQLSIASTSDSPDSP